MKNPAAFPAAIWDGSSHTRPNPNGSGETPLETYREPDGDDWQQAQHEIIAIETSLQTTNKITASANTAVVANAATTGFGYLPQVAGTPTGVPTGTPTGFSPVLYDTTAHKIWVYDAGWKATAALS